MKKSLIALALVSAFAAPAFAQTAAPAAEASEHTITGNMSLVSSYRFRGIDQTFGKPALQGGIDYSHSSGLYVGNWNSSVSSGAGFPDGNLEMDFYGGWKGAFGDFGVDVGAIYYYYPGSNAVGLATVNPNREKVNNKEIYIGGSWKFLSLKYYRAVDDYFSLRGYDNNGNSTQSGTKGTSYLDFSANYDLGDGWGVNGHVGHLNFKNGYKGSYTDWKLGVTKDIAGWVVGASYVATNAHGTCPAPAGNYSLYCFTNSNTTLANNTIQTGTKSKDAGRDAFILSVTKSF